jgi:hypothetical protein
VTSGRLHRQRIDHATGRDKIEAERDVAPAALARYVWAD